MRATETADVLSAISRASARAAGSSASGSSTRLTRPPARASSAENTRPVYVHSAACATPTSRGRNHVLAASGTTPRRANTKPIFAVLEARRTSIGSRSEEHTSELQSLAYLVCRLLLEKKKKKKKPAPDRRLV